MGLVIVFTLPLNVTSHSVTDGALLLSVSRQQDTVAVSLSSHTLVQVYGTHHAGGFLIGHSRQVKNKLQVSAEWLMELTGSR